MVWFFEVLLIVSLFGNGVTIGMILWRIICTKDQKRLLIEDGISVIQEEEHQAFQRDVHIDGMVLKITDGLSELQAYKDMLDVHSDFFVKVDTENNVFSYGNKALEQWIGIPVKGMTLEFWFERVVHPDDVQRTLNYYENEYKRGALDTRITNRIRGEDGSYATVDWASATRPDLRGGVGFSAGRRVEDRPPTHQFG